MLDFRDAYSLCMIPMSIISWPFRVAVRSVRGVRPEVSLVRLEHGEEVVSVVPLDNPVKMNVRVRVAVVLFPCLLRGHALSHAWRLWTRVGADHGRVRYIMHPWV
jgi:hypothetical protein